MNSLDVAVDRAVQAATEGAVTLAFGRVQAVQGRTATINLGGVDVPGVPVMKSYNAAAGDWAWCLRQGTLLIAIGCTNGTVNDEMKGPQDV